MKSILQSKKKEEFTSLKKQITTLTNTQISDEELYVEIRKIQETFIDNTLDKPQLLLKRQCIRECINEKEQLKDEKGFQAQTKLLTSSEFKKGQQNYSEEVPNIISIFCKLDFLKFPGKLITQQLNERRLKRQKITF